MRAVGGAVLKLVTFRDVLRVYRDGFGDDPARDAVVRSEYQHFFPSARSDVPADLKKKAWELIECVAALPCLRSAPAD